MSGNPSPISWGWVIAGLLLLAIYKGVKEGKIILVPQKSTGQQSAEGQGLVEKLATSWQ